MQSQKTVEVTYGDEKLTDKLPENTPTDATVTVKVLHPQYEKNYIIATYNGSGRNSCLPDKIIKKLKYCRLFGISKNDNFTIVCKKSIK